MSSSALLHLVFVIAAAVALFAAPAPESEAAIVGPLRAGVDVPIREPDRISLDWPAAGPVSNHLDASHPLGIDIGLARTPTGPISVAAPGTVVFAGGNACCSYGYYVVVDHGNGFSTLYAHLSRIFAQEGQWLDRGVILGLGGNTGRSTSAHLHFELQTGDARIDPLPFLPPALPAW